MKNHDPLDVEGQERDRETKRTQAKLARDSENADLVWLMSSKRGRRIIWRQLDRAGVFRLSFNTNAMQMAFAEGNRNEGLRTLSQIHTLCPEFYATMVKEQKHDRNDASE